MENAHYHGTINIEHKSLYFALSTLFLAILPFTATHFAAVPQQSIWNIFAHHLKKKGKEKIKVSLFNEIIAAWGQSYKNLFMPEFPYSVEAEFSMTPCHKDTMLVITPTAFPHLKAYFTPLFL